VRAFDARASARVRRVICRHCPHALICIGFGMFCEEMEAVHEVLAGVISVRCTVLVPARSAFMRFYVYQDAPHDQWSVSAWANWDTHTYRARISFYVRWDDVEKDMYNDSCAFDIATAG